MAQLDLNPGHFAASETPKALCIIPQAVPFSCFYGVTGHIVLLGEPVSLGCGVFRRMFMSGSSVSKQNIALW